MLENLSGVVGPGRAALLHEQLKLLRRAAERYFDDPEDRAAACTADYQGVGAPRGDAAATPPRAASACAPATDDSIAADGGCSSR
jgi:hypothetical protein